MSTAEFIELLLQRKSLIENVPAGAGKSVHAPALSAVRHEFVLVSTPDLHSLLNPFLLKLSRYPSPP
jgi:hypothetical protein